MGLLDIVLPSWTIPLYRADYHVREIEITRHTDVLGYPIPENARPVSLLFWSLRSSCIVLHSSRLPMWIWTTCFSYAGTWRLWWQNCFGIAFPGHQATAVEVPRLTQQLMMMMHLQLGEEKLLDADAWFFFSFICSPSRTAYFFYSQSLRMYNFYNICALSLAFYLFAFEYNFLHLFGFIWIDTDHVGWNPLHLVHWKSTYFYSNTILNLLNSQIGFQNEPKQAENGLSKPKIGSTNQSGRTPQRKRCTSLREWRTLVVNRSTPIRVERCFQARNSDFV